MATIPGEATIEYYQETARQYARAPIAERCQGNRGHIEIIAVGIVSDELVRFGSMTRKGDDDNVIGSLAASCSKRYRIAVTVACASVSKAVAPPNVSMKSA